MPSSPCVFRSLFTFAVVSSLAVGLTIPGIALSPLPSAALDTLRTCVGSLPLNATLSCFAPPPPPAVPASDRTDILLIPGCDPREACSPSGGHVPRCPLAGLARALSRLGHRARIAGVAGSSGCRRDAKSIANALPTGVRAVLIGRDVGCARAAEAARYAEAGVRGVLCLAGRRSDRADFGLVEVELGLRMRRRRRPLPVVKGPWGDGEGREERGPDEPAPQVDTGATGFAVLCVGDCGRWVTKATSVDEMPEGEETDLEQVERLMRKMAEEKPGS